MSAKRDEVAPRTANRSMSYFDALSNDELGLIWQHWVQSGSISHETFMKLTSRHPGMGIELKEVAFEMVPEDFHASDDCIYIPPQIDLDLFQKLVKSLAGSIVRVSLCEWRESEEDHGEDVGEIRRKFEQAARILVDCCPNVKKLYLNVEEAADYFDAGIDVLLHAYGPQLEKSYIAVCENESKPCLTTIEQTCTSLRSLEFYGVSASPVRGLLPAIGTTLKEVKLVFADSPPVPWREILRALLDNCVGLKSILLDNPLECSNVSEWDYAHFLLSFGNQLESAYALTLGAEKCEAISEGCPNLKCIATMHYIGNEQMGALGDCLHAVSILIDERRIQEEERGEEAWRGMEDAFYKCTRVAELEVESDEFQEGTAAVHDEWVGAMFAHPLKELQQLYIEGPMCIKASKLRTIGNVTGALKSIDVALHALPDTTRAFEHLVETNPNLEEVEIDVMKGYRFKLLAFFEAQKVALSFMKCRTLKSLHLHLGLSEEGDIDYMDVQKMHLPQQFRSVDFTAVATLKAV